MENIDVNYPLQNRHQVLQKYENAIRTLRKLASEKYNIRPFYFDNFLQLQYFHQPQHSQPNNDDLEGVSPLAFLKIVLLKHILDRRRQIVYWLFYMLIALLCFLVYRHESESSGRSVQSFVYPGMRMWRHLTLPVIQRFPRLTELYDESCLMENPFYQMDKLSCDPCAHVQGVLDLTKSDSPTGLFNKNDEQPRDAATEFAPFVFKINQKPIQLDDFYNMYTSNHAIFQRDAYRVQSTNHDIANLDDLFGQFNATQHTERVAAPRQQVPQTHNLWRCNRMLPARLLRQLFARPARLPSTGIALERFIAIDTPQAASYTLPHTECVNVYVQQALGERFIILRPTSECRHRCRTLSIRLPQSFVLSYNWRFWKPISAPDPVAETLSISLIGSYC